MCLLGEAEHLADAWATENLTAGVVADLAGGSRGIAV